MNTKVIDSFQTPWKGDSISATYREGTCDRDTLISCIIEDEYRVGRLPLGGVAIDLGAYIGGCTMALASRDYFVYAVEMFSENCELAETNFGMNDMSENIHLYENAITSKDGEMVNTFHLDTNTELGKLHKHIGTLIESDSMIPRLVDGKVIQVSTISLKTIFEKNEIKKCDFMKVDIEGSEWDIFENIPKNILFKIDRIAIELEGKKEKETSTGEFLKLLGDDFIDASQEYFPKWCNPGRWVHGYFIKKEIYEREKS